MFNIKELIPENAIIPISRYDEFKSYSKYMDMSKVYIVNQTVSKDSSFSAFCLTMKVINFIRKGHYDVIHTDCMLDMWNLLLYPLFRNRFVLTVHDPFPHTGEISFRKNFIYKIACTLVKRFVLLNRKQKDRFCGKYNINPANVLVNQLGVYDNIRAFLSPDVKEKKNNVLFFGRISPYKGIEYLCKAMLKVREQIPDATLTIAGGGKIYFDITPYNNQDWVDIRNHYIDMEELAEVLQQCTVSVCPYTDATQSGVVMTCYSLYKPVIATNVGGLGEMVENGKTGILVSPKDVDSLADAIIALLKDEAKRKDMQKYIRDKYYYGDRSWGAIADKYAELYNSRTK
ncbi:MAG: glycosyltransferase family 4 protein [Muribaculaceae bacterium]|nr:glycosyltransferase family 4 protein [Muribaculaceae bacterium]